MTERGELLPRDYDISADRAMYAGGPSVLGTGRLNSIINNKLMNAGLNSENSGNDACIDHILVDITHFDRRKRDLCLLSRLFQNLEHKQTNRSVSSIIGSSHPIDLITAHYDTV